MGNTTIIELNHDQANEIFQSEVTKLTFLMEIEAQLKAFEYSGREILGGKVLAGFHRSGSVYDKWIKFKFKMKW